MYKLLLDTNVLVDYYLAREPGCSSLKEIISLSHEAHALYVTALSLKDMYYLVASTLKSIQRGKTGKLSKSQALSCQDVAWGCVKHAIDSFVIVNMGLTECLDAFVCRSVHGDFEDNLILSSARTISADYLVTGDANLCSHSPVAALQPRFIADLLLAENDSYAGKTKDS